MNDRSKLPLRNNCEGFFFTEKSKLLAKKTSFGVIFPGGGIDGFEDPINGMIRETYEETGAKIDDINLIKTTDLIWDENWIKTDKQKKRYEKFKGDKMYFFTGKVICFEDPDKKENDFWFDDKIMHIDEVINHLKERLSKESSEYIRHQLDILENLKNE